MLECEGELEASSFLHPKAAHFWKMWITKHHAFQELRRLPGHSDASRSPCFDLHGSFRSHKHRHTRAQRRGNEGLKCLSTGHGVETNISDCASHGAAERTINCTPHKAIWLCDLNYSENLENSWAPLPGVATVRRLLGIFHPGDSKATGTLCCLYWVPVYQGKRSQRVFQDLTEYLPIFVYH